MSITLGTGTQVDIASTYATPVTVTAISNANPAVCTAAGHTLTNGMLVEVTSGWELLTGRIARVIGVAAGVFSLEGIDTTSTTLFPAGAGAGSVRQITAWLALPLVREVAMSGGEQEFVDTPQLIHARSGRIPSSVSGIELSMQVYYVAAPSAGIARVQAVQALGLPVALRARHPAGDLVLANGYWSIRRLPTMTRGEARISQISFAALAVEETIYAA